MVPGESGVATDLAIALVKLPVDGVVVMADEFEDVNAAAVLRVFREAGYAKLENDPERDKDAREILAGRAVEEGVEATGDGKEEVLVVLDHWEAPPEVFREFQELLDDDRSDS